VYILSKCKSADMHVQDLAALFFFCSSALIFLVFPVLLLIMLQKHPVFNSTIQKLKGS